MLESKFYSFTQTFYSVTAQYLMSYVKKKKKSTLLNWCSIWWTHWPLNSQCSFCTVVRFPDRCLEGFLSSVPSWHFIRKLTEVGSLPCFWWKNSNRMSYLDPRTMWLLSFVAEFYCSLISLVDRKVCVWTPMKPMTGGWECTLSPDRGQCCLLD